MRILVFGRNGQVAASLAALASESVNITALGRDQADLMREGAGADAVKAHPADIIVNAAAYTAVDKAEEDHAGAERLNAAAAGELAQAAKEAGAHFIHISTDYVFDGASAAPYAESDAANPVNIYGETKLRGERAVLKTNDDAVILRTSWVFSEFGANFVKTILRLAADRDSLNVVDDQIGGPTSARDIAQTVLSIAQQRMNGATGAGLYHYQSAAAASWAEFAEAIVKAANKDMTINFIPTTEYPTPAPRPLRTVLDCTRIKNDFDVDQPDWRPALTQVIGALT